ncbi:MAG: hypothetical protein RBS19_05690 [Bacteroidales bacterium]|jgi:hypothetical protein|nr:hypothetical protein [Bacteroidales bacterium]
MNITKKELSELKGGALNITSVNDVSNNNSSPGCYCTFNDNDAVENNNTIEGCRCNCSKTNLTSIIK